MRSEVVTEMTIFTYVTACDLVEITNVSEELSVSAVRAEELAWRLHTRLTHRPEDGDSTFPSKRRKQTTRRHIPKANILQNFNMNMVVYAFCLWKFFLPLTNQVLDELKDHGCDNVLPGLGFGKSQGKGAIDEGDAMMELRSAAGNRRHCECHIGHQELYKIDPQRLPGENAASNRRSHGTAEEITKLRTPGTISSLSGKRISINIPCDYFMLVFGKRPAFLLLVPQYHIGINTTSSLKATNQRGNSELSVSVSRVVQ